MILGSRTVDKGLICSEHLYWLTSYGSTVVFHDFYPMRWYLVPKNCFLTQDVWFCVCVIAGAGEQLQCSDADNRKGIQSVKRWMLVCLWWWFDWSFARAPVVTSTSIILSCNKIHPEWRHSGIGLQGLSWEMTVKRVTSYRVFRKFANPIPVGFFTHQLFAHAVAHLRL